jgi:hypothetical protein
VEAVAPGRRRVRVVLPHGQRRRQRDHHRVLVPLGRPQRPGQPEGHPHPAAGRGLGPVELPAVEHPQAELGRRSGVPQAGAERDLVQSVHSGHDLPAFDRHRVGPIQQRDGVEVGDVPARAVPGPCRRTGGEDLGQPAARLVHPPPRRPHVPAQLARDPVDAVLQLQHPLRRRVDAERGPDRQRQLVRQLGGGPAEPVDQLGPDDRQRVVGGDPADPAQLRADPVGHRRVVQTRAAPDGFDLRGQRLGRTDHSCHRTRWCPVPGQKSTISRCARGVPAGRIGPVAAGRMRAVTRRGCASDHRGHRERDTRT